MGVEVDELLTIVHCGQFVSHVEDDGVEGVVGHEVVLSVKQAIGSTIRFVSPEEIQRLARRVDLSIIGLGAHVSSWVLRIWIVRG